MSALVVPTEQSADVMLTDGSSVRIRPITPADRDGVQAFMEGVSLESLNLRFFGTPNLDWAVNWSVDVDYADRYGIVAETGTAPRIVAHAAYIRTGARSAEIAFLVGDSIQGHGIATLMLAHLAGVARQHGIERFSAEVLGTNHRMIRVFRNSGFPVTSHADGSVVELTMPTELSESTVSAFEQREQLAAASAVRYFLSPQAVAIVGASDRPGTVGAELIANVVRGGFTGLVYPVNRRGGQIAGTATYPSVLDLPEPPDLAVIAVPAADVSAVAADCAAIGAKALLVISAGFGEVGSGGRDLQDELLELCRCTGMRLIGPNCLGVINTDPAVGLNATFAMQNPPRGHIGFLSQSGGLGIALIEAANRLGLGLSSFVSVGNKADISGNDLLEYWEHDPATSVILMYLESFGNPRRFARIARRVSETKPILVVKSGRSPAGARATSSHTGALLSASDVTVDALFRQAGVIRTDTIGELLDTAALFSAQPAPQGRRVAIVTNGGGPGILCADACQSADLDVVELSADVQAKLSAFLPAGAAVGNPVDMIATAPAEAYRRTIEVLAQSGECDAVISLFVPPLVTTARDVVRELDCAAGVAGEVTCAAVFMDREMTSGAPPDSVRVPRFEFPEDAVRALAHAVRYAEWRARPAGAIGAPDGCRPDEARTIIERALGAGVDWLSPGDVAALLDCYGLPLIPTHEVRSTRGALRAAASVGYPVALKAVAPGLIHKSDAGGVEVGLSDDGALRAAARRIRRSVRQSGHELSGFVVQPMVEGGIELLLGVVHDESFGPVVACGAGGTAAELLGDVSVRITPLSDLDAREMLTSLRTFPLLTGYRGSEACDLEAVHDALLRLSALVDAHPEIAELDANPLLARADGALIVDARIRVLRSRPEPPLGALRSMG